MRLSAFVLVVACGPASAVTPDEAKATVKYLQKLQSPDGGFLPSQPNRVGPVDPMAGLRATSAAVRPLKALGGDVPDKDAAAKFVKSCFDDKTGGFADRPGGKPDVAVTAVGLMACAELGLDADPAVAKAVKYLQESAKEFEEVRIAAAGLEAVKTFPKDTVEAWIAVGRKAGTGDARTTGSATALILHLGGEMDAAARTKAAEAMKAGQRADGGFGKADAKIGDPETTYRVMRALRLLEEKPKDAAAVEKFVAGHRNADGGYAAEAGKPSSASGTYYAVTILKWLK